jgi:hypothetical protein
MTARTVPIGEVELSITTNTNPHKMHEISRQQQPEILPAMAGPVPFVSVCEELAVPAPAAVAVVAAAVVVACCGCDKLLRLATPISLPSTPAVL